MISTLTQYISVLAFLLPTSGFAAQDAIHVHISDTNARQTGALITFEQGEIHVPPGSLSGETDFKMRDLGFLTVDSSKTASLPKGYTSNERMYAYSFENDLQGDVIVHLKYVAHGKDRERKDVLYQEEGSNEWKRLRTVVHKSDHYVEAVLPERTGKFIFAKSTRKKEGPIKKIDFTDFGSVPHSDTAAVIDTKSGKFLFRQEASKQRPIASVSKLATSLVFLESKPDLNKVISYSSSSDREGATVDLGNGDQLSLKDVLMGTLMPSANNMAVTLSRNTSLDQNLFIVQMNNRMKEMHLNKTQFFEPSGLDQRNVSSAGNLARLGRYLFNEYPDVFSEALQSQYHFGLRNSGRAMTIYSTNKFDGRGKYDVTAFKTGYYPGYAERTLVIQLREKSTQHEITVVLLGNPEYGTIFDEAYTLADWSFQNWEFHNY